MSKNLKMKYKSKYNLCLDNKNKYWNIIKKKRKDNFEILYNLLKGRFYVVNSTNIDKKKVPLALVIKTKYRDNILKKLNLNRIFAPVHWRKIKGINYSRFSNAKIFANNFISLPIDQRYGEEDMQFIAKILSEH